MGDRKNDNSGLFAMPEDERFLISDHVEDIEFL